MGVSQLQYRFKLFNLDAQFEVAGFVMIRWGWDWDWFGAWG